MALIGTISGSVGAGGILAPSNAITGTLVIANPNIPSGFPSLPTSPADTVVFIQGATVTTGEIHTSGTLKLVASAGDEGGELFLNKPVTNTAISTGVTIDVYQNKLRFFEAGGTARGYYVDITNGGASAGTNLSSGGATPGGSDTYVQFNDGGTTFGGDAGLTYDKTTDSLTIAGDLAVNGGDITTTSGTGNVFTNLATSLAVGGTTPAITIGTSTGQTTVNIATGGATVGSVLTPKTVNIGANTSGTAAVFVNIGSNTARPGNARITLHNEVHLTSGTLVGSPGSVNNELTLISSGSTIIKLDTNNDGPGHRFEVRDFNNGVEFAVGETGDAEITGNLLITGSALSTQTTTTFNLLTTSLTGTLNVASLANSILVGGTLTTSSIQGSAQIDGRSTLSSIAEKLVPSLGGTGTVAYDLSLASIFYANNPSGNITANFTNVPTTNNRILTPTIILSQSATARIVSAVQIDTAVQTINWANNVVPTGNANKQDVFGFSLIRSGSAWKVLGQMSTYG